MSEVCLYDKSPEEHVPFSHESTGEPLNAGNMLCQQQQLFPHIPGDIGFSFLNHTAEITEAPIVMLSGHEREGETILYGDLFANYSIFSVGMV